MDPLVKILLFDLTAISWIPFWILPIVWGLRWARAGGISGWWMLFGAHPLTGWIAFFVIRKKCRRRCPGCGKRVPNGAVDCIACGTLLGDERNKVVRWVGQKAQCLNCGTLVDPEADSCSCCSAPAPRIACPACRQSGARIEPRRRVQLALVIAALLFFALGFWPGVYRASKVKAYDAVLSAVRTEGQLESSRKIDQEYRRWILELRYVIPSPSQVLRKEMGQLPNGELTATLSHRQRVTVKKRGDTETTYTFDTIQSAKAKRPFKVVLRSGDRTQILERWDVMPSGGGPLWLAGVIMLMLTRSRITRSLHCSSCGSDSSFRPSKLKLTVPQPPAVPSDGSTVPQPPAVPSDGSTVPPLPAAPSDGSRPCAKCGKSVYLFDRLTSELAKIDVSVSKTAPIQAERNRKVAIGIDGIYSLLLQTAPSDARTFHALMDEHACACLDCYEVFCRRCGECLPSASSEVDLSSRSCPLCGGYLDQGFLDSWPVVEKEH